MYDVGSIWAALQADLHRLHHLLTMITSRAFLIGSLIQLYESLDKRPVTVATLQH